MPRFPGHRSPYDLTYNYGGGGGGNSDVRPCVRIAHAAQPCPGVELRFSAVIDCTPGERRMPPVTIDFVSNRPAAAAGGGNDPPAPRKARMSGRFTCDSADLALPAGQLQLRRAEEMVAAAGLPAECAPSVGEFLRLSASSAGGTFFEAVAVTVEAAAPGGFAAEEEEEELYEDEAVPPGADSGECPICYLVYVVGGGTSVALPCGHAFHRRCIERWASVNPTCPYCRTPVPESAEEHRYWGEEDGGPGHGVSGRAGMGGAASRPPPSTAWSRVRRETLRLLRAYIWVGFIFSVIRCAKFYYSG